MEIFSNKVKREIDAMQAHLDEYNDEVTPLYYLSKWNKRRYAERHGYELRLYEKGPTLDDPFKKLFMEPPQNRPRVLPRQGARDALGDPEGDRSRGGVLSCCPVARNPINHATKSGAPAPSVRLNTARGCP